MECEYGYKYNYKILRHFKTNHKPNLFKIKFIYNLFLAILKYVVSVRVSVG